MINKWLKKLELTDWTIELEAIKHEQVLCDEGCPPDLLLKKTSYMSYYMLNIIIGQKTKLIQKRKDY
jgi:hypothetical protein